MNANDAIEQMKEAEGAFVPIIEEAQFNLRFNHAKIVMCYYQETIEMYQEMIPTEVCYDIADALGQKKEYIESMFLFYSWASRSNYIKDGELDLPSLYRDYAAKGKHPTFSKIMRELQPRPPKTEAEKQRSEIKKRISTSMEKASSVSYRAFQDDSMIEHIEEALGETTNDN